MGFNETMQAIVNLDTEEKIHMAADAFFNLQPVFEHFDPKNKGMEIIYALIGTTVVADGKLTEQEFAFVKGMLEAIHMELTEEQIISLCEYTLNTQRQAYMIVKELSEQLNDDGVTELITFIAALCAIDDRIDPNEVKLIKSLF